MLCGDPANCNTFNRIWRGCEEWGDDGQWQIESSVVNKCVGNAWNNQEWIMIEMDDTQECASWNKNWQTYYDSTCTITEYPQCTLTYEFADECDFRQQRQARPSGIPRARPLPRAQPRAPPRAQPRVQPRVQPRAPQRVPHPTKPPQRVPHPTKPPQQQ
eukprot:TRINITY_DN9009_c0_g1_i1.p1 TRINITY_DN9009_c0_g1~~TRINITY_DN9009_c0_g1_i1.p1  ORF type:complete len:159 (-),score=20.65 TRINITY_DN9009_c0_g1_i1:148-624(-)